MTPELLSRYAMDMLPGPILCVLFPKRGTSKAVQPYSHSIVPGGFDVMSYTTRLIPRTSLTIRLEIARSTSYGNAAQSAAPHP